MALFGVFATHSPESCPLNNDQSRDKFVQMNERSGRLLQNTTFQG